MREDPKVAIYEYLNRYCQGKPNAVKAKALAGTFSMRIRDVADYIRALRKSGILIGSSKEPPCGYYIPAGEEETKEYLNTFKSELFDMLQTFNAQRRARRQIIEQGQYKNRLIETRADADGQLELILH
ncbi:MAG: hypothetical protein QME65_05230 [Candidatus Omnitrophota bacterium]|nr:hypothetical protein [Candidatus Omnitrophota bacterium]